MNFNLGLFVFASLLAIAFSRGGHGGGGGGGGHHGGGGHDHGGGGGSGWGGHHHHHHRGWGGGSSLFSLNLRGGYGGYYGNYGGYQCTPYYDWTWRMLRQNCYWGGYYG